MNFAKYAVLMLAATVAAAAAPVVAAQQNPEPAGPTAPTAAKPLTLTSATPAPEGDDTAALIAQANAAAAANAKAEAVAPRPVVKQEPSPAARKKAREYGFHAEMYDGKNYFCRDDATVGTRIESKRCMNAEDFEEYGRMMQLARDLMKNKNQCQGGGICGGLQ